MKSHRRAQNRTGTPQHKMGGAKRKEDKAQRVEGREGSAKNWTRMKADSRALKR
jgi:hypothetical protein